MGKRLAVALLLAVGAACTAFGTADTPSDGGANADGGSLDAGPISRPDGSATSICDDAGADICEDFDTDSFATDWPETVKGPFVVAPTADQSYSGARSLGIALDAPKNGDDHWFQQVIGSDFRGLRCRFALFPVLLNTSATTVLWLQFPGSGNPPPPSAYDIHNVRVVVRSTGDGPMQAKLTSNANPVDGGNQTTETPEIPIPAAQWTALEALVDHTGKTMSLRNVATGAVVDHPIPDARPVDEMRVRLGAGMNTNAAPTLFYVDDVACWKIL